MSNNEKKMKWVGLTGGIASGKSTVTSLLRQHGYNVVDADELAKRAVAKGSPGLKAVVNRFGEHVLGDNGELDRKKLGAIVFADSKQRELLESIIHPFVQEQVERQKQKFKSQHVSIAFYDVPLLYEKNMFAQFDHIILVTTSEELQKERMQSRDALPQSEIAKRMASQISMSAKEDFARKNPQLNIHILRNDRDQSYLIEQLKVIVDKIKNA